MPFLAITSLLIGIHVGTPIAADPNIMVPQSSISLPLPFNVYNHTNYVIYKDGGDIQGKIEGARPGPAARFSLAGVPYTPQNVQGAYGDPGTGGSGTIVIIDAYDEPTAAADFNTFSSTFGLPTTDSSGNSLFQKMYTNQSGALTSTAPGSGVANGWAGEESLDIEWTHAMAPYAKIVLIESPDNGNSLYNALKAAVAIPGVREVSMSWGGGESTGELSLDASLFGTRGPLFFAATGDTAGEVIYPSSSPNVIACGGTSLYINTDNSYNSEKGWSAGGGNVSSVEPLPAYQKAYGLTYAHRSTPDISAIADPNTGVYTYEAGSWYQVGGTSLATPVLAGLHNSSTTVKKVSEINWLYFTSGILHDITSGGNNSAHNNAVAGYDLSTGLGSPITANSL